MFKQAKRLGILDGVNPMQDVSIPRTPEPEETYAYTLAEVTKMLSFLAEPTRVNAMDVLSARLEKETKQQPCNGQPKASELRKRNRL